METLGSIVVQVKNFIWKMSAFKTNNAIESTPVDKCNSVGQKGREGEVYLKI